VQALAVGVLEELAVGDHWRHEGVLGVEWTVNKTK